MRPYDFRQQLFVSGNDPARLLGEVIEPLQIMDEACNRIVNDGFPDDVVNQQFSGNRLIGGQRSASKTALPRISAASAIWIDDETWSPVPCVMRTLINPTMCREMKKKRVGGNAARNSSLIFSKPLFTALTPKYHCAYCIHYRGMARGRLKRMTCRLSWPRGLCPAYDVRMNMKTDY